MLTEKKVLEIFTDYLKEDQATEVVWTRRGVTVMLWESAGQEWSEAVCCDTPEKLFDKLLDSFTGYQEYLLLQKKEQIGEADRQKIQELCQRYVEKRKEEEGCDCL